MQHSRTFDRIATRPHARRNNTARCCAIALSLLVGPAGAFTLSPNGVVERTLAPGATLSESFTVSLGPNETFTNWDQTGVGTLTVSQSPLQADYSFSDPGDLQHCQYVQGASTDIAADIVANGVSGRLPVSESARVRILYLDPLTASETAPVLSGAPGETVVFNTPFTGGLAPYIATSALGADVALSDSRLEYRYRIPASAAAGSLSDTVTLSGQDTNCGGNSTTITVTVNVLPGLAVSPSMLNLAGDPGQQVTAQLQASGGVSPYQARANLGQVSVSGATVNYSARIPADAPASLTDTIVVTDAAGATRTVDVLIQVFSAIAVTPSPLELSALSLVGVEGEATKSFGVSGGTPPYTLAVASGGSGTVEPASLDTAGSAIYAVAIPASSAAAVISDRIVITDSSGTRVELPVTVDVAASDALSSRTDLTPNERSVAQAIETVCPQLAGMSSRNAAQEDLFQQCSQMLENSASGGIPNTLEQVTTEKARAATSAAVETGNQQLANIGSRLAALRGGASGLSLQGFTLNVDGQPVPVDLVAGVLPSKLSGGAAGGDSAFGRWGFFLNGSFNFGDKDTTENESGFDFNTAGITAGADYRFSDKLVTGGAVGYASSDLSFDSSGGGLDTETWHLAAYGTYSWTERFYVDAIVEYGWQSYDARRNIRYQVASTTSAVSRQAKADYDGTQFGASIGAGYDIDEGPLSYGVYGRAGYIQADVDGYREQGAGGLDLSIEGFDATSVTTTLGARISRVFNTNQAVLVPQARAEWEHEYDQDADTLVARFAADPTNTAFGIATDSPDRDYFRLGVGLSAIFPHGVSAFINYDTILDQQYWTDHLIDVGVRWELY